MVRVVGTDGTESLWSPIFCMARHVPLRQTGYELHWLIFILIIAIVRITVGWIHGKRADDSQHHQTCYNAHDHTLLFLSLFLCACF